MQDNIDKLVRQLTRLNNNIDELSSAGTGSTKVKTKTIVGDFTLPGSAIIVANEKWEDERVDDLTFNADLQPGETETVASIISTNSNVTIAPRAVGVTRHPYDIDGDNENENAVEYQFEYKANPSDGWGNMNGLTGTTPLGKIGEPEEIIPGSYIGPVSAFRIRIKNITDQTTNQFTIGSDEIGAQVHAKAIRGGGDS